jgi:4-hydroxy-tetrahydrodipicolinate reductase
MDKIRVAVCGTGFMGRQVLAAVTEQEDMQPVGVIEKFSDTESVALPDGSGSIPLSADPGSILALRPDVVIDFTNAEWTSVVAPVALEHGVRPVIGTTNLNADFVRQLETDCAAKKLGAFIAPNFALGAVVMMHLARIASRYFDYAEIVETHQERKIDSPSGTALATARAMVEGHGGPFLHTMPEKEPLSGARGAVHEGVAIHSERMPGAVAHHEVVFGGLGQTLRIKHDSIGRESFIPGVLLATREVMKQDRLVIGLDRLIGL